MTEFRLFLNSLLEIGIWNSSRPCPWPSGATTEAAMGTSGWAFSCKNEVLFVFPAAVLLSTLQDLKVSAVQKEYIYFLWVR